MPDHPTTPGTGETTPQQRAKCACPSWTGPRECMEARIGESCDLGDECECLCHEEAYDADDWC